MRLVFVRHGETEGNQSKLIQGHLPGELTETGKRQAKLLAERLGEETFSAIYSSDLKRAKDTAEIIAEKHGGVPLSFHEELRDMDWGSFSGKKKHEVNRSKPPADAETFEDFKERIASFFEKILEKHRGENVLFVAHSWTTKMLLTHFRNHPAGEIPEMESTHNTSVNVMEAKGGNRNIVLENCAAHLEEV